MGSSKRTAGEQTAQSRTRKKVIVVGAGISGLAAARELIERRYDVLVLEARTRPGGRLRTLPVRVKEAEHVPLSNRSKKGAPHPLSQRYASSTFCDDEAAADDDDDSCDPERPVVPIDVGGAFIHGVDNNPLSDLCHKAGIPTQPYESCILVDHNGWPVEDEPDRCAEATFNETLDRARTRCEARDGEDTISSYEEKSSSSNEEKKDGIGDSSSSFGSIFQRSYRDTMEDKKDPSTELTEAERCLFKWHKANLELSCGTNLDRLGQTWNEDEPYGYDGAHVQLSHGFGALVEILADGVDICYGAEVKCIKIVDTTSTRGKSNDADETPNKSQSDSSQSPAKETPRKTRVMSRKKRQRVVLNISHKDMEETVYESLTTNTEKDDKNTHVEEAPVEEETDPVKVEVTIVRNEKIFTLRAEVVILTVPLGVLQANSIAFHPPIPPRKALAIQRMGCGVLNKCVLSFSSQFWPAEFDFIGYVDLSSRKARQTHMLWVNVAPLPLVATANRKNERSSAAAAVGTSSSSTVPVLVVMFGGTYAEDMERESDAEVVSTCLRVLGNILGGAHVPSPVDSYVTRWKMDKFAKGAFSFVPPGVNGWIEHSVMSQPIAADGTLLDGHKTNQSSGIDRCHNNGNSDNSNTLFDDHEGVNGPSFISTINKNDEAQMKKRPKILFAGEHTTQYHPSTIHGAYHTGIREAYRLDLTYDALFWKDKNIIFEDTGYLYQRTFKLRKIFNSNNTSTKHTSNSVKEQTVLTADKRSGQAQKDVPVDLNGAVNSTTSVADKIRRRWTRGKYAIRQYSRGRPVKEKTMKRVIEKKAGADKKRKSARRKKGVEMLTLSDWGSAGFGETPKSEKEKSGADHSANGKSTGMSVRTATKFRSPVDQATSTSLFQKQPPKHCLFSEYVSPFSLEEDIALLRGADAFGRDETGFTTILSKMAIPYGIFEGRNVGDLAKRYKELVLEGADLNLNILKDPTSWLV